MPRKIIAISNHGDMIGGGEYSFLELMKNLHHNWPPITVVPKKGVLKELLHEANLETHISPLSSIRPWTVHKISYSIFRLVNLIKKKKPDLIYANGPRAAFYACMTKPFHRIPVIWHCRIADKDFYLDWLLSRGSDSIIANSNATAKRFKNKFLDKIKVVYNGIDISHFKDDSINEPDYIGKDWKVILVSARISRQKRHDIALDVFDKIATSQKNAHIIFIGGKDPIDQEWWEFIQNKSLKSKFTDRIHWKGNVADVRPWYKSASILLFPAENEAFGRVIVEAMACGLPIVASESGGIPELVRNRKDGLLIESGNINDMASAIETLLDNSELHQSFAESAKEHAESFSLNTHVSNMIKLFEQYI